MPHLDPTPHWHGEGADRRPRRLSGLAHRLRRGGPRLEERLAQIIEEHRHELQEQTLRFEETLADLERREQLLADSRASVERLLRLGTKDLDARESDVARLVRDLTERDEWLREQEQELARRRSELGAVELKRLAVEQRERAINVREERLEEAESRLEPTSEASGAKDLAALAFVPGERYSLVELEPQALVAGDSILLGGVEYSVSRIGRSPLPRDRRPCAFLLQRARGPRSGGSS